MYLPGFSAQLYIHKTCFHIQTRKIIKQIFLKIPIKSIENFFYRLFTKKPPTNEFKVFAQH